MARAWHPRFESHVHFPSTETLTKALSSQRLSVALESEVSMRMGYGIVQRTAQGGTVHFVLNNSWSHFSPPSSIFLPLLHHHHPPPHMISLGAHLAPETVTMFGNRFFEDVRSHWRGDWCLCNRTVRVSWKWGRRGGAQQGQSSVIALTEEHWLATGKQI